MIRFFLVCNVVFFGLFMAVVSGAHAMELLAYKDTATMTVRYPDAEVERIWSASTPACLKDGARLLGVNKAFKQARLGYRDCSQSANARIKQKALGFEVAVIKLTELSDAKIKQVLNR